MSHGGPAGVVHAAVSITARRADVHSGVEGGADREPMMDMVKLLATLTGDVQNRITLPGFYERVPVSYTHLTLPTKRIV